MLMVVVGLAMMAGSTLLLNIVRFREGQVSSRPEWLDISLAILVTSGLSMGFICAVAGGASWLAGVSL